MYMKKRLFATMLAFMAVFSFAGAEGATTSVLPPDVRVLQAQVESLMKQIESLKGMLSLQGREIKILRTELSLSRRLKQGSSGDDVKMLQELLATDPEIYPEGKITGVFGSMTEKALSRFQEKYHLDVVGETGPKTLELLNRFMREGGVGESGKIPKGLLQNAGRGPILPLLPQNDSGLKGYTRILDNRDGRAVASIELFTPGVKLDGATTTRPVNIYAGNCATSGVAMYALSPVVGGRSSTTLSVSTKVFLLGLPLSVGVSKSVDDATFVACGEIKLPARINAQSDTRVGEVEDGGQSEELMQEEMIRPLKLDTMFTPPFRERDGGETVTLP